MANQKGSDGMYRTIVLLLLAGVICTGVLYAHGNEKHVMGKVKAIAADSISVETESHHTQAVRITSQTRFVRAGKASGVGDLKVGDRVVIHAKQLGDWLEATEVKWGTQTVRSTAKQ
jgi:hypothetical protein